MVHVKRVELTNFKSFGGTTSVPLLPGFTVISGPNGSGKSNILDALLFCLGLSSSKGMRADRLPDLVNNNQTCKGRGSIEASVTVTFDLSGEVLPKGAGAQGKEDETMSELPSEWSVTRRLRVNHQGGYTSSYYINGVACTLAELHDQLNNLRIYPEGYNVVLQGDVTSIISMNARERREIIDELAGVSAYDRKITQAKKTLDEVKDKEDSCRIIERELTHQRDRLSQDRGKAEKYQRLRTEFLQKQSWQGVLSWRGLQAQLEGLIKTIEQGDICGVELSGQLTTLNKSIADQSAELEALNAHVKALGEDELLAVQSTLATQAAEHKQLQRQQTELTKAIAENVEQLRQTQREIEQYQGSIQEIAADELVAQQSIIHRLQERDQAQQVLDASRTAAAEVASASEAWVQQQTAFNFEIESLLQTLEPQRTEQAQLRERNDQLQLLIREQTQLIARLEPELAGKQTEYTSLETEFNASSQPIQTLAENLSATEQELQIQQETQRRLLQEQREKQRQLDKIEAQAQAQQEVQGTQASKVILQSGLPGLCGLVVQLAKVDPLYQLALEIAAGGRLGHIVVEDDSVAAAGIELLKQKRAGRATFLPLTKIRTSKLVQDVTLRYVNGFVDYAVNLIECDGRYQDVFNYVFGNTVVFTNIQAARSNMGLYRIVTLDGELLETSGAMTGGSVNQRSTLKFATGDGGESQEVTALKSRLGDIDRIIERCTAAMAALSAQTKQDTQLLTAARQTRREQQLQLEHLQKEINNIVGQMHSTRSQLQQNQAKITTAQCRLSILDRELPGQEKQLQQLRQALAELEQSQTPSEWQKIQVTIKEQEQQLKQTETELRNAEEKLTKLQIQQQRSQEKIQAAQEKIYQYHDQQERQQNQLNALSQQEAALNSQISTTKEKFSQIEQNLGAEKQKRDMIEEELRSQLLRQQQIQWEIEKLQQSQARRREELTTLQNQIREASTELPDPLPEVPDQVDLEELEKELRTLGKRLQSMEPVNMLALEEYERTQNRLQELTEKLQTLAAERTELLLRIENFTTLRQLAFKEAFDAVNQNFQSIFAILSEGDGHLQLENPEDIFNSGLNLVAHPKGKPVQRLASMSGGEKSLTALSFIFALQRYRPSPFYAFDEVDMFLDGANVERLAKMIKQQAQQAQFIVVSLRRPMIESAERTIGVTQARGAYTQVLGIKLPSPNTSA
ncbi:chromosome segregation protein SMC [Chrysosporum bergii ANA360D]|uniref:Chromosome partition protein Smc n=1 Tax=Chrysosporum bergii ANA360D TaxID=617107 RepID=A0AA43GUJ5_9CYAN|nr:chromosome segregation protein SMC [Chrysosporum bergii]MDH6061576.1 chromosome segregation protein SMC [Chrysosporum bergii ANA360D]